MFRPRRPVLTTLPLVAALPLLAAGCGAAGEESPAASGDPTAEITLPTVTTLDDPEARLAVTYDGGVMVVRAADGEVLADEPVEGFLRVNPAGDDRHVFVSGPGGFRALDLGAWSVDHGDHGHSYADDPELTDFVVPAEEPGHVVVHDGRTTLFDDATGTMTALETADLGDLADLAVGDLATETTEDAHHGVALWRVDGGWLHTVGTVESRDGAVVTDGDGAVVAETDQCPGVHGETVVADERVVLGCEDGVVVFDGTAFTKVDAPDDYARIGNLAGSEESPVVLGDYKTDEEAELERPTRVSLVDTTDGSLQLVDLPGSYTFRSLGRTADGGALVLGTDGALHLVDPERGTLTRSLPVVAPWEEPLDWEQPRPALEVVGDQAFVTEPATSTVHVVDLTSMSLATSYELPQVPNEIAGITG